MAREPTVSTNDVLSLQEMIAWVKRARDSSEMMERVKASKPSSNFTLDCAKRPKRIDRAPAARRT